MPSIAIPVSLRGQLLYSTRIFDPLSLFALNEPGIWLDPSDVANLDWRRNLLTYTEQFDNNSVWGKSNLTIAANTTVSPDGIGTADTATRATTGSTENMARVATSQATNTSYTLTVYVKANTAGARLYIRNLAVDNTVTAGVVQFNPADGTVSTTFGSVYAGKTSMVSVGDGWWRCSITGTTTATISTNFIDLGVADGSSAVGGASGNSVFLWGAQLELGSVATDYQRISDVNTEVLERFPRTTMFQDRAGSTAVTTPGQSVGLRLDKSKGLVLGPELVTNGDFSGGTTGWTVPAGWSITGGAAVGAATSGSLISLSPVTANRIYRVEFDVVSYTSGTLFVRVGAGTAATTNSVGRKSFVLTASGTNGVEFYGGIIAATIDNISVKELPGFHAVANSDAARGIYGIEPLGGRRNLLTFTEQFDNAAWMKTGSTVAANSGIAPDGTTTADKLVEDAASSEHFAQATVANAIGDFTVTCYIKAAGRNFARVRLTSTTLTNWIIVDLTSGAITLTSGSTPVATSVDDVGSGWYRLRVTSNQLDLRSLGVQINVASNGSTFNYLGDGTSGILIWGAQLELGSTATAYQKVTTQYDVTEAGKQTLHYVQYDGSDDGYVTPTITPGIDKVQVFAGVRKLSDAAVGVVIEHSASWVANVGSFILAAPGATSPNGDYSSASRGNFTLNANQGASTVVIAAPVTNVIAATHDIAGDFTTIRANGVQLGTATGDKGTGNFLAYPLYIGRRGGTTLPFNGRDYGIITRFGANLDASTIAATESWLNQKTGVTL